VTSTTLGAVDLVVVRTVPYLPVNSRYPEARGRGDLVKIVGQ